jgi:double-GTPase-like protein
MRANGMLEMDSYRLAAYTVPCPCYICGGGNNFDAELCRHCQAPMALSHQATSQKIHPRMIAAIGPSGAGKTVYLGMLTDMLSRQDDTMQLLARGAFSIKLQQHTMSALSHCEFPNKTPNEPDRWHWVHCQVLRKQKKPVELIMPDLAGEALLEEVDHPGTYPVIHSFLTKCSSVMILIDAPRAESGDSDEAFHTMKLVSYLSELTADCKNGWQNRPVALVFTKADQCEDCFENPAEFGHRHTTGLVQQCRERLKRHQFFAVGVAGAVGLRNEPHGRMYVPLRIEPRGIVEPFQWLLEQLDAKSVASK